MIKFVPFFLNEGVKGLYRFVYGIIALNHFKIEKKEEEKQDESKPGELATLKDQITTKKEIVKMPANEVDKLYKETTNKFGNWGYFMDTVTVWDLTHRNNTYTAIKITSELRKNYPNIEISATTVMHNVRKNEWKVEIKERPKEEKINSKYVYIQVDEDHVKQRNKKGCTISKIITIYTRKRILTKPERIPEVKQIRKELVDKFTFSGLYKDTQEMWEDVAYYIDCTYDKEELETAFIMGDGASYIKAGTEWIAKSVFVLDTFHLEEYINHLNYDEYLKEKLQEAIDQFDPISTENILKEAIRKIEIQIEEDEKLGRTTKSLENRLKKIKDTKTYLMNQWQGIEAHDIYKDKLTGCCQEGQVHHTLSERLSTDAKVWSEEGIDEMSQLRAFTQNGGDVYQKIIDISTEEKREKKIQELEKRIRKKANKKIFGSLGAKIPISKARDELYLELKKIWYGNVA